MVLNSYPVAVIMPIYNVEPYLKEAIESILNQTFKDWVLHILDDCSTDNSFDIAKEYAMNFPNRIKIYRNESNMGCPKSLNKLLDIACYAEYIARQDGDDVSCLDRLENQYNFMEGNIDIDLLGTCCDYIDEKGNLIGDEFKPIKHDEIINGIRSFNPFVHGSIMMRQCVTSKIGKYDDTMEGFEDWDFWSRISEKSRVENLPMKLYKLRHREGSTCNGHGEELRKKLQELVLENQKKRREQRKVESLKRVSVIIPVYNSSEFLVESIDSIVNQTYKNMEILIVDDCSTDNSYEILKRFAALHKNIKLFKNDKNLGVPKSLNFLLRQVTDSDYIARHDADDISMPERIEKQVAFLNANLDISLVGSYYIHIDQVNGKKEHYYKKPVSDYEIRRKHFIANSFVHGSVMFRKGIIDIIGYYDEDCGKWEPEDYDYWTRAIKEFKVANIPETLYKWRCYPDNRCGMSGKGLGDGHKYSHYKMWCREMGINFDRSDLEQ